MKKNIFFYFIFLPNRLCVEMQNKCKDLSFTVKYDKIYHSIFAKVAIYSKVLLNFFEMEPKFENI